MQGVFLRLHNRAVDEVAKTVKNDKRVDVFKTTQQMVRDHYQYVVMNDFIAKIVSDNVLKTLKTSDRWDASKLTFGWNRDTPFMPVEFSVAAYRLGHSMVRPGYRLNDAIIEAIFPVHRETGSNFPEGLTGFRPLITDWAIDWSRFIPIEDREYGPNPDDLKKPATQKAGSRNVSAFAVCLQDRHVDRRSARQSCRRRWRAIRRLRSPRAI